MFKLPDLGPLATADDFEPHIGLPFLVSASPKPVEIRLDRILRRTGPDFLPRQPFTLILTTPMSALLTEGVYTVTSPAGREVEMHIVPTQTYPSDRRFYHAVFG